MNKIFTFIAVAAVFVFVFNIYSISNYLSVYLFNFLTTIFSDLSF